MSNETPPTTPEISPVPAEPRVQGLRAYGYRTREYDVEDIYGPQHTARNYRPSDSVLPHSQSLALESTNERALSVLDQQTPLGSKTVIQGLDSGNPEDSVITGNGPKLRVPTPPTAEDIAQQSDPENSPEAKQERLATKLATMITANFLPKIEALFEHAKALIENSTINRTRIAKEMMAERVGQLKLEISKETLVGLGSGLEKTEYFQPHTYNKAELLEDPRLSPRQEAKRKERIAFQNEVLSKTRNMVTDAIIALTNEQLPPKSNFALWTCALIPKENGGLDAILRG